MQTITITPHLENGRYYIDIPNEFSDAEFTIQIILKNQKLKLETTREKLRKIRDFAGIAADTAIQIDKSEWYMQ